jgi:hypothetical protein
MPAELQQSDTNGRDHRGRFVPGNNQSVGRGRPKAFQGFREQARAFMDREGIAILLDMARQRDGFAVKLLAEYAYGKPQQFIDLEAVSLVNVTVSFDRALDSPSD